MKKSLFLILGIVLLTGLCTGCGNNASVVTNVDKLDSKIDYFVFRNKKIYLTNSFVDYVLQYKGMGCKLNTEGTGIAGNINIDDINSSDHEFYNLSTERGSIIVGVECYEDDEYFPASFSVGFEYDLEETLLKNKKVDYWNISPKGENVKVYFDGTELSFGGDGKESTKEDVKKMLGSGYEENTYYDNDIDITIDNIHYAFSFSEKEDSLLLVAINDYR